MEPVDIVVGAVLAVASLRGLFLGLVREAFSLAALGCAYIAVTLFTWPVAEWLAGVTGGRVGPRAAPWLAGAGVGIAAVACVALLGRLLRRGVRAVGLGWLDRLGGAALGLAEGALVAGILLALASTVVGRDHPALADSRSLAALERLEGLASDADVRELDVAAPPRS
jgi:membrane protein required for colicin V production